MVVKQLAPLPPSVDEAANWVFPCDFEAERRSALRTDLDSLVKTGQPAMDAIAARFFPNDDEGQAYLQGEIEALLEAWSSTGKRIAEA